MPIPHNQHIIYPAPASLCAAYCVPENQSMPNNSCAMGYECWTTIRNRPTSPLLLKSQIPFLLRSALKPFHKRTWPPAGMPGPVRVTRTAHPQNPNIIPITQPSRALPGAQEAGFRFYVAFPLPFLPLKNSIPRPKSGGQTESSSLGPYRYCLAGA